MPERDEDTTAAEFLAGSSGEQEVGGEVELDVLQENWEATHVFAGCSLQYIGGGMAAPMATGITATEAMAAIEGMQVDLALHPHVFDQVIEMGRFAAHALNERNR